MNTAPSTHTTGTLALIASAAVLSGLVLSQIAGRDVSARVLESAAIAQSVNQGGPSEVSLLATDIGTEDVLVLIDQRREDLMLYRIANQRNIDFKGRESLRELFVQARGNVKRGTPTQPPPNMPGVPAPSPMPR